MRIRVDEIKESGLCADFEETFDHFPVFAEMAAAGECRFLAPIRTSVRALSVSGMVEVSGTVETQVQYGCCRCLREFDAPLRVRFDLTYTREMPAYGDEGGEEGVELSADELGLILFHGEEIDLDEAVQEQVVLGLPFRPLCRTDCKGLCPQCGADLNEGTCGCPSASVNIKFAALKDLKIDRKD